MIKITTTVASREAFLGEGTLHSHIIEQLSVSVWLADFQIQLEHFTEAMAGIGTPFQGLAAAVGWSPFYQPLAEPLRQGQPVPTTARLRLANQYGFC